MQSTYILIKLIKIFSDNGIIILEYNVTNKKILIKLMRNQKKSVEFLFSI